MIFERLPDPFGVLVIKDSFAPEEAAKIKNEVVSFAHKDADGSGIWINDIYKDVAMSAINSGVMDTFFQPEVVDHLMELNSFYGIYKMVNNHNTLFKYYGHGRSSVIHNDAAAFTIMTFMFDEPRNFVGGNITLQIEDDVAYEQNIENNMSIIFPSSYYISLSEIELINKDIDHSGLYTISSFLFIQPN